VVAVGTILLMPGEPDWQVGQAVAVVVVVLVVLVQPGKVMLAEDQQTRVHCLQGAEVVLVR